MSVAEDKTYTIISWHLDIDFGIKIKTNTTNRNQSFQNIIMSKLWLECFWITNTENPFCEWFFLITSLFAVKVYKDTTYYTFRFHKCIPNKTKKYKKSSLESLLKCNWKAPLCIHVGKSLNLHIIIPPTTSWTWLCTFIKEYSNNWEILFKLLLWYS